MKAKEKNKENLVKVSEEGLLSLVGEKIKDRVLFPQKLEEAKEYVKKIKLIKS